MTIHPASLVLAFLSGIGLAAFYLAGLWWTVRLLPNSRSPALLTVASFFGRLGVLLLGFYGVMGGRWERLAACFMGFLLTRYVLVRWWTHKVEISERKGSQEWTS